MATGSDKQTGIDSCLDHIGIYGRTARSVGETFLGSGGLSGDSVAAALALLPPLVVTGLLLGAGHVGLAISALLLSLANIISLNLAAILTFLIQGVRPAKWWEAYRARKTIIRAIAFWTVLLIVMMFLAILLQN